MTPRDIINEAASHGVALSIHDGQLRYSGDAQAVAAVLPLLREHKAEIIKALSIPERLDHPRNCPLWPSGCLAGCAWYHGESSDFCWRCDEPWWSTVYDPSEHDGEA